MGQVTSGLRAILSHPAVYTFFQNLMGAHSANQRLMRESIRAEQGMRVLDIGCGPAAILEYMPEVEYWGFDISEAYIASAKNRYGKRGHFACRYLSRDELSSLPQFDLVLALGLLHHLEDAAAAELLDLAHTALKPGGRLVTVDPCLEHGQNPVARFLVRKDRGQNVRTRAGYDALASRSFAVRSVKVRHTAWIPYTHCIMECSR